jgi:hypothetical protein
MKPKQFYLDSNLIIPLTSTVVFKLFSQDGGHSLSAIEFVKLCKLLKVYPVIIQFDFLKKIILKAPEYWHSSSKSGGLSAHTTHSNVGGVSEIVSTIFTFKDFFKAFKVRKLVS